MCVRLAIVLVLLFACRKPTEAVDAAPAAIVSTSSSASAPAVPRNVGDLLHVVGAWNDATNAHDAKKLATLYADSVELYGTRMTRERAVAIKDAAFAKHDHDDVTSITVTKTRATFRKKSKAKDGKVIDVTGYLDVDAAMKITAEGDTTTDANLARNKENRCDAAILALVESTAEGRQAKTPHSSVDPPEDGGPWTLRYVTAFEGGPDGAGNVMGWTFTHDVFEVDAKSGTVKHAGLLVLHDGDPLTPPTNDAGALAADANASAIVRASCN